MRSRPRGACARRGRTSGDRAGPVLRQEHPDGRSAAGRALDRDRAAALADDSVDRGEAESGALADGLGREERVERVGRGLGVHARAGVADAQDDVGPRLDLERLRVGGGQLDAIGLDRQRASGRHRVAAR